MVISRYGGSTSVTPTTTLNLAHGADTHQYTADDHQDAGHPPEPGGSSGRYVGQQKDAGSD
jgi:hypothetical protein